MPWLLVGGEIRARSLLFSWQAGRLTGRSCTLTEKHFWFIFGKEYLLYSHNHLISDSDLHGSAYLLPARIRIRKKCRSRSTDNIADQEPGWKMPISLTFLVRFLVMWKKIKFFLLKRPFPKIFVHFGSCGKMLKTFLFQIFFLNIWISTIFINALDLDPDPHQNFRSDPDPHQNNADPKHWNFIIIHSSIFHMALIRGISKTAG